MTSKPEITNTRTSLSSNDAQLLAEGLVDLSFKVVPTIQSLFSSVERFLVRHEKKFQAVGEVLLQFGQQLVVYNEFRQNCRKHDIIPHEFLFELIQERPSFFIKSHSEQSLFFNENWPKLKRDLFIDYSKFCLKTERLEIFDEILNAHEAGLYKVCIRSAVIEIEGLASDFCLKHEDSDNIKQRKKLINNWKMKIEESDVSYIRWYFVLLTFENYIHNFYLNSNAKYYDDSLTDNDMIFSRNYHAHGFVSPVTERQSLNAILYLHNFFKYFSILDEVSSNEESTKV